MHKSPGQGGCWFCSDDNPKDLVFESEWDTMVHLSCLRRVLEYNPEHCEASLMRYLLDAKNT